MPSPLVQQQRTSPRRRPPRNKSSPSNDGTNNDSTPEGRNGDNSNGTSARRGRIRSTPTAVSKPKESTTSSARYDDDDDNNSTTNSTLALTESAKGTAPAIATATPRSVLRSRKYGIPIELPSKKNNISSEGGEEGSEEDEFFWKFARTALRDETADNTDGRKKGPTDEDDDENENGERRGDDDEEEDGGDDAILNHKKAKKDSRRELKKRQLQTLRNEYRASQTRTPNFHFLQNGNDDTSSNPRRRRSSIERRAMTTDMFSPSDLSLVSTIPPTPGSTNTGTFDGLLQGDKVGEEEEDGVQVPVQGDVESPMADMEIDMDMDMDMDTNTSPSPVRNDERTEEEKEEDEIGIVNNDDDGMEEDLLPIQEKLEEEEERGKEPSEIIMKQKLMDDIETPKKISNKLMSPTPPPLENSMEELLDNTMDKDEEEMEELKGGDDDDVGNFFSSDDDEHDEGIGFELNDVHNDDEDGLINDKNTSMAKSPEKIETSKETKRNESEEEEEEEIGSQSKKERRRSKRISLTHDSEDELIDDRNSPIDDDRGDGGREEGTSDNEEEGMSKSQSKKERCESNDIPPTQDDDEEEDLIMDANTSYAEEENEPNEETATKTTTTTSSKKKNKKGSKKLELVTPDNKAQRSKNSKRTKKVRYAKHSPIGYQAGNRNYKTVALSEVEGENDDGDGNVRRSKRKRFAPLAYWKNERLIYEAQQEEGLLGEAMGDMPVVSGILQAMPTPYKKRKVERKKEVKSSSTKKEKRKSEKKSRSEDDSQKTYNPAKRKKKFHISEGDEVFIWDEFRGEVEEKKLIRRKKDMKGSNLPLNKNRVKGESTVVGNAAQAFNVPADPTGTSAGWIGGNLHLPPRGIKDAEGVGLCTQVFNIGDCQPNSLEIAIADPEVNEGKFDPETAQRYLLSKGDSFYIPAGNIYRIENLSSTVESQMTWTIIRPIKQNRDK